MNLVNLKFNGQAVAIPTKASADVMPLHSCISCHDILDGTGGDMAVVRQSRGERRTIVEGELWSALRHLELLLEGIDLSPVGKYFLFLFREVWFIRNCSKFGLHEAFFL